MNEEMFKNLSNMLGDSNNSDNLKNIVSNFTSNNSNNSSSNYNENNNFDNFDFSNIDMATIMKIKNAMSKMNSKKDDPRSNLLLSLKPYLKPSKKEKLDQYMKFMNISSVIEVFNSMGGENVK